MKTAPLQSRSRAAAPLVMGIVLGIAALSLAGCGSDDASDPPSSEDNNSELDAGTGEDASPDTNTPDIEDEAPDEPPPEPPETLGGERPARLVLPDGYTAEQSWPLLILLHGFGASGSIQDVYLGLSPKTTAAGFILVLPDGTENGNGERFWNATPACCGPPMGGPDDVAYISGLIEEASETLSVDRTQVFLIGHSNGGFMSYRMACDRPDLISGVVVLAGAMLTEQEVCEPDVPVSVMHAHGTDDETIFFEGRQNGNAGDYPSALASAQRWADLNGCAQTPETLPQGLDFVRDVPDEETQVQIWSDCRDGASVELYAMEGAPHVPSFTSAFIDRALAFFSNHPKPTP